MTVVADEGLGRLALDIATSSAARLDVGATLMTVCTSLPAALGLAASVALLLDATDPSTYLVFASGPEAARLGELQRREGNGPVVNAIRSGRLLATGDLTRIGPPALAVAAEDTGLVSSVALPLVADGYVIGALQLLGTGEYPVTIHHATAARPIVDALAAKLSDARQLAGLVPRLQEAALVEQAKGMLAERHGTDASTAFRMLQEHAERSDMTVGEAAAAVAARTHRPSAVPAQRVAQPLVNRFAVQHSVSPARHRRSESS